MAQQKPQNWQHLWFGFVYLDNLRPLNWDPSSDYQLLPSDTGSSTFLDSTQLSDDTWNEFRVCSSCNSSSWLSELCSNAQLFHPLGGGFRTTASCGYLSVCAIRDRLPYSISESPSPTLKTQLLHPQLSIPAGSLGAAGIYIESVSLQFMVAIASGIAGPWEQLPTSRPTQASAQLLHSVPSK